MSDVLKLNQPPTMRELWEDEYFRAMMRRRPKIPANLTRPGMSPAWHVWVMTTEHKWKRGKFFEYEDAFKKMREQIKRDDVEDVAITCIRLFTPPPIGFRWQSRKFPWCGRCRRPSLFLYRTTHRAINFDEPTLDEPYRCWYCGVRKVALPRYSPR